MPKPKFISANNIEYSEGTPAEVVQILETAMKTGERLVLDYGHADTGKSWGEVYDIAGYIGRSTGQIKIPLLIHNSRSVGGGAILTDCIVCIKTSKDKRVLWQHPTYQPLENP
jgi:hypothetical protein